MVNCTVGGIARAEEPIPFPRNRDDGEFSHSEAELANRETIDSHLTTGHQERTLL